jgi:hypothetical protein
MAAPLSHMCRKYYHMFQLKQRHFEREKKNICLKKFQNIGDCFHYVEDISVPAVQNLLMKVNQSHTGEFFFLSMVS